MKQETARLSQALAGRYRIEHELGSGGMATVFLADDVRHRRKVALKVLRPELAAVIGAERFLKEIEVTANLQHPHILPLHDSGEADGFLFYVMPYVEGESLRARLERDRQLGVAEAIELTRQAASALDYAHRHGVIHRDIKPENILLHDSQALIADFGIALAVSTAGGTRMTETGMSLGTPHYMSPEQAMGDRAVDARSDVYALGCVAYEMLVGEPPFTGPTAQAIVAKVITERPPLVTAARETAPAHVAAAVQKALAKLPADRFASAAEFAEALANPQFAVPTSTPPGLPAAAVRRSSALPWAVAAGVAAASFWLGGRVLAPDPPRADPVVRVLIGPTDSVTSREGPGSTIAFSPDGSRFAFLGFERGRESHIFLRLLDRASLVAVAGTESAGQPTFSPDGQWLAFHQEGRIRKVAIAGGSVTTIAEIGAGLQGLAWGDDDFIVFARQARLWRVPAAGGTPELLAAPDSAAVGRVAYRWPEVLPGSRNVLFTLVAEEPKLAALSLADRRITELGQPGLSPRYVSSGHLAFAQDDGTLFAAPFDVDRVRFTGPPEPIADGLRIGPAAVAKLGISRTGAIAYPIGTSAAQREVILVDRQGSAEPLPIRPGRYAGVRFSPDGRRLALMSTYPGPPFSADIWTVDLGRGTMSRITFDSSSGNPEWAPDGHRIVFIRRTGGGNTGVFAIAVDGSGLTDTMLTGPRFVTGGGITPDGRRLVYTELERTPESGVANSDIWVMPVDSPGVAQPLLRNRYNESAPAVSPDGEWLAYQSNETGGSEVYVRRLAGGGARERVSTAGGNTPQWRPDGLELIYRGLDTLWGVPVQRGAELVLGKPRALFGGVGQLGDYTIHPDGNRFVFVRAQSTDSESIELILNWFDQRRARR